MLASTAYAQTPLGNVAADTTLKPALTYLVDGQSIVFSGATLTIPAGTHLVFTAGSRLTVKGSLLVKGTATKHVVIAAGTNEPFIPLAMPLVTSDEDTQTPEAEPTIEDTTMHADTSDDAPGKHAGIEVVESGIAAISYLDISDAMEGLRISSSATSTADHATFTNCDRAIMGLAGGLKLTNSSFANVAIPGEMQVAFAFTHSNTTFSSDGFDGWVIGGGVQAGQAVKLNSTDGAYDISGLNIVKDSSLTMSAGTTALVKDRLGVQIAGKFTASGTADKPITIYGDGACTTHSPVLSFLSSQAAVIGHVNFKNLCDGIYAAHSTVTMTNDTFETIAGPAVNGMDLSTINANTIAMHNVYQAFDIENLSHLNLSGATIAQVNGTLPAIKLFSQSPLSGNGISIDGASTCISIGSNSSITVSHATLAHCTVAGIFSDNDGPTVPSGITLTDSEISQSGTALKLNYAKVINVSNDSFHDNTVGVSLSNMPKTTIINNAWGSNKGPRIASNPDGDGDSIVAHNVNEVIYRPWLGMTTVPASNHNPIIIVPGITGTVLNQDYGGKGELWPNIAQLALSITDAFLDELKLLVTGKQNPDKPMKTGDIVRSVSSTDIFGSMIASLAQAGYVEGTDLFVLPYDWRLSNTENQALLKDAVANALEKSGKDKVNIIAHSMGGLLVKDYLAENADAPIDHLFYIGVPHLGAPKAFQTLMYGDDMGFKFSVGPVQVPLLNSDTVKEISQNMPSVYELLPSEKYISKFGAYVRDDNQANRELSSAATQSLMVADGRNEAMFPFAKTLHDDTDLLDGGKYPTYDFAGCGSTKAVNSFTLTQKKTFEASASSIKSVPEHRIYYAKGDGVVPVKSATAGNGATNYYVTSGSHGTLPSLPSIQHAILNIINGDPVDTSDGISANDSICSVAGETVEVHSPVTLDIYDDQNRHTGPTADGEIEYGIPNVQYEMIGTEKFAFLPDGPVYKIVDHALSTGTYDMYIDHSDENDEVVHELYFRDVPLSTANATGTVVLDSNYEAAGGSYQIDMDEDGDGVQESSFGAAYSFDQTLMNDRTPPVTTAAIDANSMVTLTAQDDLSHVKTTWYFAPSENQWRTYQNNVTSIHLAEGATMKFFSIDNRGNIEDMKQFTAPTKPAVTPTENQTQTPAVQTPTVTPTTVNYGDTIINNPPATTNIPADSQSDQPLPQQETATQTPETEEKKEAKKPAADSKTQTDQVAVPSVSNPADTLPENDSIDNDAVSDGSALPPPHDLLASATGTIPSDGTIIIGSLSFVVLLIAIYVKKRFYSRKKKRLLD